MTERIFVSIASYRDPECQWTIKDLFAKADDPGRVFVGICWQFDREADAHCFVEPCPLPANVRVIDVPYQESRGACWARSRVQSLWQGEEYVLQIDSHMRFVRGWDSLLIAMTRQTGSAKPLLSVYPPGYLPPDVITEDVYTLMLPTQFSNEGILGFRPLSLGVKEAPARPVESFFVAAGFMFAPSAFLTEIPYDPYLYFYGEEISIAVRAWTHGWDIFAPNAPVTYHFYNEVHVKERKHRRTSHWDDHAADWVQRDRVAKARIAYLLRGEEGSPEDLIDIDHYGLGSVRSMQAYEEAAGVSFRERRIFRSCAERMAESLARAGAPTRKEHIYFNFAINHLERNGNEEDAIAHSESLLASVSLPVYRYRTQLGLGAMYGKRKSFDKQRAALMDAVVAQPLRAEAFVAMAKSFMEKEQWSEALPFAHAAMAARAPDRDRIRPDDYTIVPHALAAVCYAKIGGMSDEAVLHAKRSLELGFAPAEAMQRIVGAPDDPVGVDLWLYPDKARIFESYRKLDVLPESWVDWIRSNRKGGISETYLETVLRNSGFKESVIRDGMTAAR